MIDRKSKKRSLYLTWLAAAVMVVVFTAPALAQENPNDPLLLGPNMPEELRLPGTVEGTGTYFEVTDSNYLNITFESTEPVHLRLESVPEMIVMDINTAEGAASTHITLTGFEPSITYYKYEDDYHNEVTFTTDENGSCTFAQDLTQPHLVFIQPNAGTIFIPGDTSVGTWDPVKRIFTLTTDVYETIQITQNDLTLDGAGYTVKGPGQSGYGVYLYSRTGVTVKSVNAQGFYSGIYLGNSSNNILTANTTSNNRKGIHLYNHCSGNTLTGNTTSDNILGIDFYFSSNNTLTDNTVSNTGNGIYLFHSSGNTLTANTSSNNYRGIYLSTSSGNTLTGNTTCLNNYHGIQMYRSSNNTLTGNTASNNGRYGIMLYSSSKNSSNNNTLTGNTISSNSVCGLHMGFYWSFCGFGNQIYNNNFIDNTTQAYVAGGSGNVFNLPKPTGGNYWSDWTTPDADGDGFVDYPYVFYGGQDNLPWTRPFGAFTPPGTYIVVQPVDETTGEMTITLTFDEVTEVGVTTVTSTTPGEQQGAPEGFKVGQPPTIFNISTTATFTGYVLICINYSGISFQDESTLELFHYENGEWVLLPTVLDTENDIICGAVTSLSPFAIFESDNKLPVSIDIKPGSYPNAINLGSYGLVPLAILSSEDFDATTIDPDTVELSGATVAVRGKSNKYMAHQEDVNGDGLVDLVLQVATQNFDPDSFQDGYAVLIGETYDGVSIEGEDEITIVPPEP